MFLPVKTWQLDSYLRSLDYFIAGYKQFWHISYAKYMLCHPEDSIILKAWTFWFKITYVFAKHTYAAYLYGILPKCLTDSM